MSTSLAEVGPRIAPAPRLPWLLRLGAWLSQKKLGRVMAVIPYVYARVPGLVWPHARLLRLAMRLHLPRRLVHLVELQVSADNGCSFCADLHGAVAVGDGLPAEVLEALPEAQARADLFDPLERAVLAWARELTLTRGAGTQSLAALREHLDDRQIVELTWLVAFTGYLNTLARGLGLAAQGFCAIALSRAGSRRGGPRPRAS